MRILGIHRVSPENYDSAPPVDLWRIYRPLRELEKHMPDWEFDSQPKLVWHSDGSDDSEEYDKIELEVAARNLGAYDIVFMSYYALNRAAFSLMMATTARHGTQFVIDIDDDLGTVNEDNPIWLTSTREEIADLRIMSVVNPWLTTTTETLYQRLRDIRRDHLASSVAVIPNYIPDDYQHPPLINGPLVIGYFGGSSHFADLNDSGFRKAMRDIMKKYKHVEFRACGVPLDIPMSRKRESFLDGARGEKFVKEIFPQLRMDIAVAPLLDNPFNKAKSNIKWQEATRAGAAVIASNIGPYEGLAPGTAILVNNTRAEWYAALEYLVVNRAHRDTMVRRAQEELAANWRLEDHWEAYRDLFERVKASSSTPAENVQ